MLHTQTFTHPCWGRKLGVSLMRIFWVSVSQMRKHTHTYTHTDVCLIKTYPIDVLLCTALHSSSPPIRSSLASLWASLLIFIKASLPTFCLSLARRLIHSGLCHWAAMYLGTYLLAFSTPNSLLLSLPASHCVRNKASTRVLFPVPKTWITEPR